MQFEYINKTKENSSSRIANIAMFIFHLISLPICIIHEMCHIIIGLMLFELPNRIEIYCIDSRRCKFEMSMFYSFSMCDRKGIQIAKSIRQIIINAAPLIQVFAIAFFIYSNIEMIGISGMIAIAAISIYFHKCGYFLSHVDIKGIKERIDFIKNIDHYNAICMQDFQASSEPIDFDAYDMAA